MKYSSMTRGIVQMLLCAAVWFGVSVAMHLCPSPFTMPAIVALHAIVACVFSLAIYVLSYTANADDLWDELHEITLRLQALLFVTVLTTEVPPGWWSVLYVSGFFAGSGLYMYWRKRWKINAPWTKDDNYAAGIYQVVGIGCVFGAFGLSLWPYMHWASLWGVGVFAMAALVAYVSTLIDKSAARLASLQ